MKNVKNTFLLSLLSFSLAGCSIPLSSEGKEMDHVSDALSINEETYIEEQHEENHPEEEQEKGYEICVFFDDINGYTIESKEFQSNKFTLTKDIIGDLSFDNRDSFYLFLGWEDSNQKLINTPLEIDFSNYPFTEDFETFNYEINGFSIRVSMSKESTIYKYNITFRAAYERQDYVYKVEYRDIDETVLYVDYVKPHIEDNFWFYDASSLYMGKNPKRFFNEGPKRFVGFDLPTDVVRNDLTLHAVYDFDDSIEREACMETEITRQTHYFSSDKYISLVHNSTAKDIEIRATDYASKNISFILKPNETRFFDITEGIISIYTYFETEGGGKEEGVIVDYYKEFLVVKPLPYKHLDYDEYYEITISKDDQNVVIPGTCYNENGDIVPMKSLTINVENPTANIIVLSGMGKLTICDKNNTRYFYGDIQIPNDIGDLDIQYIEYNDDNNFRKIDGCYYFGNKTNPYLFLYDGQSTKINQSTEIVKYFSFLYYAETRIVPASVRKIFELGVNGDDLIFENINNIESINKLREIRGESYYLPVFNFDLNENFEVYGVNLDKLYINDETVITKNFMNNVRVKEFALYGDSENPYLAVEDGVLYTADFKELIMYNETGKDFIYVKDGVVSILAGAFQCSARIIYIPSSVKNISPEYYSSRKFVFQDNHFNLGNSENYYYGQNSGERFLQDGLVFAINNDKSTASIISYDQKTFNTDLVIPNFVSIDGKDYQVTKIADYAFDCRNRSEPIYFNSIDFGNSLKYIGYRAFEYCYMENNLFVGKNIVHIESLPCSSSNSNIAEIEIENINYFTNTYLNTYSKVIFKADSDYNILNFFDGRHVIDGFFENYYTSDIYEKCFVKQGDKEINFKDITEGICNIDYFNYYDAIEFFPNLETVHFVLTDFTRTDYGYSSYGFTLKDIVRGIEILKNILDSNDINYDIKIGYDQDTFIDIVESETYQDYIYGQYLCFYKDGIFYLYKSLYLDCILNNVTVELLDGPFTVIYVCEEE